MAAQGPLIWFWVTGGGAAATSLPHRPRYASFLGLLLPLLVMFMFMP